MDAETTEMEVNPLANMFPAIPEAEFAKLKEGIEEFGQKTPITLDAEGRILDGRHRYRACRELGIEPKTEAWAPTGDETELDFVVQLNCLRRQLSSNQKYFHFYTSA